MRRELVQAAGVLPPGIGPMGRMGHIGQIGRIPDTSGQAGRIGQIRVANQPPAPLTNHPVFFDIPAFLC